jgi:hypothetical protein
MAIKWNRSIGYNIDMYRTAKETVEYTIIDNGADCYPWREVFVWWPWVTTITGKRVWWKKVYKRRVWVVWGTGFHMEPETQYATAFDLLTYDNNTLKK